MVVVSILRVLVHGVVIETIGVAGLIGLIPKIRDFRGDGVDLARWDDIARNRISLKPAARYRRGGVGIVYLIVRVDSKKRGKISGALGSSRHSLNHPRRR